MSKELTTNVFVEANRHHKSWLTTSKVTGVYNDETIKYNYPGCDFKKEPFKCANENGIWVMKTTFTQDAERASVNVMLFDENATMIGQGNLCKVQKNKNYSKTKGNTAANSRPARKYFQLQSSKRIMRHNSFSRKWAGSKSV